MPRKPRKPCAQQGCPELTDDRYCEKHRKQAHRDYKQRRTDDDEQRFYGSSQWKKIRKQVMDRDGWLCQECKRNGVTTPATMVDHIKEIKDGGSKTAYSNLEALCQSCHNKKTAKGRGG